MSTTKKFKICRRLGVGVYEKCQSQKFILSQARRSKVMGRRRRPTDYGLSLIIKQRVRFTYGVAEKQFANYVKKALSSSKKLAPKDQLFALLEGRLDNVIYRLGFANTRRFARQIASHGHVLVNGKRMTIPSHQVKIGDVIEVREGSKSNSIFVDLAKKLKGHKAPNWIKLDSTKLTAEITGEPKDPDPFLDFQSVIEFYTK